MVIFGGWIRILMTERATSPVFFSAGTMRGSVMPHVFSLHFTRGFSLAVLRPPGPGVSALGWS